MNSWNIQHAAGCQWSIRLSSWCCKIVTVKQCWIAHILHVEYGGEWLKRPGLAVLVYMSNQNTVIMTYISILLNCFCFFTKHDNRLSCRTYDVSDHKVSFFVIAGVIYTKVSFVFTFFSVANYFFRFYCCIAHRQKYMDFGAVITEQAVCISRLFARVISEWRHEPIQATA